MCRRQARLWDNAAAPVSTSSTIVVPLGVPDLFYRLIHGANPTDGDFRTPRESGTSLFNEAYEREWAEGISVYDDRDFALRRARNSKSDLDDHVVPICIPEDSDVEVRKPFGSHHYAIHAHGARALALVCGKAINSTEQEND